MSKIDDVFFTETAELFLKQTELQTAFMKITIGVLLQSEQFRWLRPQLDQLPDNEQRAIIAAQLSNYELSTDLTTMTCRLMDLLELQVSNYEKIRARLKALSDSPPSRV